jgi:hypothetical protein
MLVEKLMQLDPFTRAVSRAATGGTNGSSCSSFGPIQELFSPKRHLWAELAVLKTIRQSLYGVASLHQAEPKSVRLFGKLGP